MTYYEQLPEVPPAVTAANVLARMFDSLGFRYNCATDGLRINDMDFRPSKDAMSIFEVIRHIYNLMKRIAGGFTIETGNVNGNVQFDILRNDTLLLIYQISAYLITVEDEKLNNFYMIPYNDNKKYSFWYFINGQLSDAFTHIGQITSWRRINGNPVGQYSPLRGMKL